MKVKQPRAQLRVRKISIIFLLWDENVSINDYHGFEDSSKEIREEDYVPNKNTI